jgi:hypothetical protein
VLLAINADLAAIAEEAGRGAGLNDTLFSGSALAHALHTSKYDRGEDLKERASAHVPFGEEHDQGENGEFVMRVWGLERRMAPCATAPQGVNPKP